MSELFIEGETLLRNREIRAFQGDEQRDSVVGTVWCAELRGRKE